MKSSLSSTTRKKAEALQLQLEVYNDEEWDNVSSRPGLMVVDVYSSWCGPCASMAHTLRRVKLELGDDYLTLVTAQSDEIAIFEKFRLKAEPTWLFFGNGKALRAVHGADSPKLVETIKELLDIERRIAKGENLQRDVVMLDSLVKPEEILQPDEDLDDIEGEKAARELEEGPDASTKPLLHAVVFVLPHIVSDDKVEDFLSYMVNAGIIIVAHMQQEMSEEELSEILIPPETDSSSAEDSTSPVKAAEQTESEGQQEGADEGQETEEEEDLKEWTLELTKAPLYMLLIKVESGDVLEQWFELLGPHDVEKAKVDAPQSLVAQFGSEGNLLPAWLGRGKNLQKRLVKFAFPSYAETTQYKLLLMTDGDHSQILELLSVSGATVQCHTQVTLTADAAEKLQAADSAEVERYVGKAVFAAVLTGDLPVELPDGVEVIYLSPDLTEEEPPAQTEDQDPPDEAPTLQSAKDIAIFFPDFSVEDQEAQSKENISSFDDPQTQMQIEKNREKRA